MLSKTELYEENKILKETIAKLKFKILELENKLNNNKEVERVRKENDELKKTLNQIDSYLKKIRGETK